MLFDIIYMRWFLHALPYNISDDIFKTVEKNNLKYDRKYDQKLILAKQINKSNLKNISFLANI